MEEVKFEQINKDETKMSYRDKEFIIRRDVKLLKDFQSLNSKARRKMKFDMAKEGLTINNFIATKKDHLGLLFDKNYIDEENYNKLLSCLVQFTELSTWLVSFDLYNHPGERISLLFSFYKCGNWGSNGFSIFFEGYTPVMEQINLHYTLYI